MGTLGYMSPEQLEGKVVDGRSDIFSASVVFYEIITGHSPFRRETEAATLYAVMNDVPEPLVQYNPDAPPELERIILKGLRKSREDRYQTISEMASDFRHLGSIHSKAAESTATRVMIAVIPFQNLGSPEDAYFSDGVSEEILTELAKAPQLGVISRTSAAQYTGTTKSLKLIGRELGVGYILEGTVRWSKADGSNRVRISAQLIRVSDDTHVWANQYDAVLSDIFDVQSKIATQVVRSLGVQFAATTDRDSPGPPRVDAEAYTFFLKAKEWFRVYQPDSRAQYNTVESLLKKAIDLEPRFAQAYAWLGLLHSLMWDAYYDRTAECARNARTMIDQALRISPNLPEAHQFLGRYYYSVERDFSCAIQHYTRALNLKPNDSWIHADIAFAQRRGGQWQDSITSLKKAVLLNPRESFVHYQLGVSYIYCRQYADADSCFNTAIGLSPDYGEVYLYKSWLCLLGNGEAKQAQQVLHDALNYSHPFPQLRYHDIMLSCIDGDYEAALKHLTTEREVHIRPELRMIEFLCLTGDVFRYFGKTDQSLKAYADACELIDRAPRENSQDAFHHCFAARALAGIGRREDALEQAGKALKLMPISRDSVDGTTVLAEIAESHVMMGEYDLAIDELSTLLSVPSLTSVRFLKICPGFAPILSQPRMQALLDEWDSEGNNQKLIEG
jgi:serine/threonine-protein kinase